MVADQRGIARQRLARLAIGPFAIGLAVGEADLPFLRDRRAGHVEAGRKLAARDLGEIDHHRLVRPGGRAASPIDEQPPLGLLSGQRRLVARRDLGRDQRDGGAQPGTGGHIMLGCRRTARGLGRPQAQHQFMDRLVAAAHHHRHGPAHATAASHRGHAGHGAGIHRIAGDRSAGLLAGAGRGEKDEAEAEQRGAWRGGPQMKRSGHAFPYESVEDMRPFCSGVGLAEFKGGGERGAPLGDLPSRFSFCQPCPCRWPGNSRRSAVCHTKWNRCRMSRE